MKSTSWNQNWCHLQFFLWKSETHRKKIGYVFHAVVQTCFVQNFHKNVFVFCKRNMEGYLKSSRSNLFDHTCVCI